MKFTIYTDGGCSGNPGPGGWAYVIVEDDAGAGPAIVEENWGAEQNTTNNRMELGAVIAALETLSRLSPAPEAIRVYTDSQYVQKGISQWIHRWKLNNWQTNEKKPVKNQDLWRRLDELSGLFLINWVWIKGHAGDLLNERCDRMTQKAIASLGPGR
ncbi:MAG: ribonuclease HI [Treponema sp.]|jgi:ribonuclease HI|nr:ribonuclease HI [Treponema sp.]